MKKKLVAVLLLATMTMSLLAGCGNDKQTGGEGSTVSTEAGGTEAGNVGKDDGKTDDGTGAGTDAVANLIAATEGTVTLDLWCDESEAYQNTMKQLVEEFKAKYSEVDFDIRIGAVSTAVAKDEVLKDVENAADVFVFADDQLYELVKAGALQSVDATFTCDPRTENAAGAVDAASQDGTLYAYPMTASNGYFLYYNKEYLSEEDISSWDNLLAAAEAQGKTVGMEVSGAWYLYGFFAGAGLEMYRMEDGSNFCNWNATDTKYTGAAVAEAISKLCQSPAMVNCVNEDAQAFALNGEMIADVNGTWATTGFMKAYGDNFTAAKLPTFTVNGEQVQMGSFAGYKLIGVSAYSKNTGWAMLLAEYLTNENSQKSIGIATGEGPANINAAASEEMMAAPALAALGEQSQFADRQNVGESYWSTGATLGQALVEGSYEDIQQLLDDAVAGITQPAAE